MLNPSTQPQSTAYYHCDGNGNITMLINPSQTMVAKYLYDPYGNLIAMSGSLAGANRYRFSSKEWNNNAGLYYYLCRFYDPNVQRWPNRDPIQERGGSNLYEYVANNPINAIDSLGLCLTPLPPDPLNDPALIAGMNLNEFMGWWMVSGKLLNPTSDFELPENFTLPTGTPPPWVEPAETTGEAAAALEEAAAEEAATAAGEGTITTIIIRIIIIFVPK